MTLLSAFDKLGRIHPKHFIGTSYTSEKEGEPSPTPSRPLLVARMLPSSVLSIRFATTSFFPPIVFVIVELLFHSPLGTFL